VVTDFPRILLVHHVDRSFIDRDIVILKKYFDVDVLSFKKDRKRLKSAVKDCDVVVSWFGSVHTLFSFIYANIYRKGKVVIVGGFDASDIRGYGLFSSFFGRRLAGFIYNNADVILPVDYSLKDIIVSYLPGVNYKIRVVPTGYDSGYFKPDGSKTDSVLSVCYVNGFNIWRKGLDVLADVARCFDDVVFNVVGRIDSEDSKVRGFIESKPSNLFFKGWVSDRELLGFYQSSKVFALLSKYEGLPNVLCEAMLCNCVPVGSNVCGIPGAIGDTGFIVNDFYNAKCAISDALNTVVSNHPRSRIKSLFSVEKREHDLVDAIRGVL